MPLRSPSPAAASPAPASPAAGLPEAEALLALERRVRRGGTGLTAGSLAGVWRLQQVWPRRGGRPQPLSAALLRGLGATLALQPQDGGLAMVNRVAIGALELRFEGGGRLEGPRPLLVFGFERCRLCWGERTLLERPLAAADPRRRPFFALLGQGRSAEGVAWLAARGRGGGLALWCREAGGR